MDEAPVTLGLLVSFATLLTVHVVLLCTMVGRRLGILVVLAVFVPVVAPVWALRNRMFGYGALWIASGAAYAIAWVLAR